MTSGLVLRAATRRSPLAIWQAEHVAALLAAAHPGVRIELVGLESEGDRRLDEPIAALGGKGVFAKDVQRAVLDGRADLAVHSAKDLPAATVDGLVLAAVPERADARDALVGARLAELAPGAVVATGSPRRRAQLARLRPDLVFAELRGNMATRLTKVPDGGAIVVATAALQRLGLADRLTELLDPDVLVPQVGQGALAVECRADDAATAELLAAIEHAGARRCVDAERAFLVELGGDCDLPAGAHAVLDGADALEVTAFLAGGTDPDAPAARATRTGDDGAALGAALARALRAEVEGGA